MKYESMKCVVTTLLLLISTLNVLASRQADGDGVAAIKTKTGYLIVWNQPDIHFTLGVNGKDVRPMNRPASGSVPFNVDGVVFQVQSVAISEFLKNAKKQKLSDQAILMAHRDWESQYIEQTLGKKLNVTSVPQPLSNGSQALLWKFAMPKNKAQQQVYLTMVSSNHFIILNGTEETGKVPVPESIVQRLLADTLSTFKASSRPIDVLKLRETIR